MTDLQSFTDDIKTLRDEVKLKVPLASLDARDEWERLEARAAEFESKAQLGRSAADLRAAAVIVGDELKAAYDRLRKAI